MDLTRSEGVDSGLTLRSNVLSSVGPADRSVEYQTSASVICATASATVHSIPGIGAVQSAWLDSSRKALHSFATRMTKSESQLKSRGSLLTTSSAPHPMRTVAA